MPALTKPKRRRKPSMSFVQFLLLRPIIQPESGRIGAVNPARALLNAESRLVAGGWTPRQAKAETRHPDRMRR